MVATGPGTDKADGFGPYRAVPAELVVDGAAVTVNEVAEDPGGPDYVAFHDLVRSVVRRGESIVVRHELRHYGAEHWHNWLDCIGDCATVSLHALDDAVPEERGVPYLMGPKPAIRMVGALVPVPPEAIHESRPVQTDFRSLAHLWTGDEPDPPGFAPHRSAFVLLGKGVADMHRAGMVHGDLHGGNVFVDEASQTVTPIDLVHTMFVCPPPLPEVCATDLVPLMSTMSAPVWRAFREGYRSEWPLAGRVVDLIERRDRTGWAAAVDAGDEAGAASLLAGALALADPDDTDTRLMLTMELVRCLLAQDRAPEAVEHAERLVPLAEEMGAPPGLVAWQRFSLAVAVSMAGDRMRALDILVAILRADDLDPELRTAAAGVLNDILAR